MKTKKELKKEFKRALQDALQTYTSFDEHELEAVYDKRASFYKKAYIMESFDSFGRFLGVELYSYGQKALELGPVGGQWVAVWHGQNSDTTRRHIAETLKQWEMLGPSGRLSDVKFEKCDGAWVYTLDETELW